MTRRRPTGGCRLTVPARAGLLARAALAAALVGSIAGAVASPAPAAAAGAGGIELTPLGDSGQAATAFHVAASAGRPGRLVFEVRNVGAVPAAARVYAAAVSRTGTAYAVGGPGSAPWIRLPLATVELGPGQRRRFTAEVTADGARPGSPVAGAVVEEPVETASVHRRVATLVYLAAGRPAPIGRPVVLLGLAAAMLAVAAVLAVRQVRRRG